MAKKVGEQFEQGMHALVEQAREIARDRNELGEEGTVELLRACEENIRAMVKLEAESRAHMAALGSLPQELSPDVCDAAALSRMHPLAQPPLRRRAHACMSSRGSGH